MNGRLLDRSVTNSIPSGSLLDCSILPRDISVYDSVTNIFRCDFDHLNWETSIRLDKNIQ